MTHLTQDAVYLSRMSPLVLVELVLGKDEVRSSILRGGTSPGEDISACVSSGNSAGGRTSEIKSSESGCAHNAHGLWSESPA